MVEFNEIIEKIKDIMSIKMGNKKIFDKDVACELNISQVNFASMKLRNVIPYKEIMDFCAKNLISINWLFYNQEVKSLEKETNKFSYINFYEDIYASAGGGAHNEDSDCSLLTLDHTLASTLGLRKANEKSVEAIKVRGDSMEPLIQDGSLLFINKENKDINKGGIFVVSTHGGVFVKRVAKRIDGSYELISENKTYSPEKVHKDELIIIGKAIGQVSSF